jgi:hypothetical protein
VQGRVDRVIEKGKEYGHDMLNCYYTNLRSLLNNNKRAELEHLIKENNTSIVGITETWLKEEIGDGEINISGFNLFRRDRGGGVRGGGVCYCTLRTLYVLNYWKRIWVKNVNQYGLRFWIVVVGDNNRSLL